MPAKDIFFSESTRKFVSSLLSALISQASVTIIEILFRILCIVCHLSGCMFAQACEATGGVDACAEQTLDSEHVVST